jgi:hypothetical protein
VGRRVLYLLGIVGCGAIGVFTFFSILVVVILGAAWGVSTDVSIASIYVGFAIVPLTFLGAILFFLKLVGVKKHFMVWVYSLLGLLAVYGGYVFWGLVQIFIQDEWRASSVWTFGRLITAQVIMGVLTAMVINAITILAVVNFRRKKRSIVAPLNKTEVSGS